MAGVQPPTTSSAARASGSTSTTPVAEVAGARPLAQSPTFADSDGPLLYRRALPPRPARPRPARVRHARRHLLPSRRVARRRVPRRPRGLLLPASVRHHQPRPAVGATTCWRSRSRAAPQRDSNAKRNITGVLQDGESFDRELEPGRAVATRAHRHHRPGAHRPLPRAVPRCQRHARPPAPARRGSTATRRAIGARHHVRSTARRSPEQDHPLARGSNEIAWNLDIAKPAACGGRGRWASSR